MGTDWSSSYHPERHASWEDLAQAVREQVSMDDVLALYCPQVKRQRNRCSCPIHNGKDLNFSFNRTGYKCFVCGASGDVIGFVKEVCELSTRAEAIRRINDDLRLRLPVGGSVTATQSREMSERRREAERRDAERQAWWDRYHELMDRWCELDKFLLTAPRASEKDIAVIAKTKELMREIEYQMDSLPPEPR